MLTVTKYIREPISDDVGQLWEIIAHVNVGLVWFAGHIHQPLNIHVVADADLVCRAKKSQGKNVNFSTDFTESDIIRSAVSRCKFLDEHFFRKMQT